MKYLISIVLMLLVCICAIAQDAKQQARAYYFQAETMFNAKNYPKTIEYLAESKQLLGTSNASIEALLVKAHFQSNQYSKAKLALDAFYTYNPTGQLQKQIAPFLVRVNDKLNEKGEAERKKRNQKEALYGQYIEQGNTQVQKGELPAAVESFEAALKIKPNDAYATKMRQKAQTKWNNKLKKLFLIRGEIALLDDSLDTAKGLFKYALKLVPGDTGAIRRLEELETLYPIVAQKFQDMGDDFFVEFNWRKSKESYNRSLEYRPENPYIAQKLNEISDNSDKGFLLANFTDSRDGNVYGVVQIGDQTWMSENMRYVSEGSVCYENLTEHCKIYGRLYTRNASRKACPKGWKLPSESDFYELISKRSNTYTQYTFLTSSRSGFNATTGGYWIPESNEKFTGFVFSPYLGAYWSATARTKLSVVNSELSEWKIYRKAVRQSGEAAVHEMMEPSTVYLGESDGDISNVKFHCRCIERNN